MKYKTKSIMGAEAQQVIQSMNLEGDKVLISLKNLNDSATVPSLQAKRPKTAYTNNSFKAHTVRECHSKHAEAALALRDIDRFDAKHGSVRTNRFPTAKGLNRAI